MDLVDVYERSKAGPKPFDDSYGYTFPHFHFCSGGQVRCLKSTSKSMFHCTRILGHPGPHEAHHGPKHACSIDPWID